MSTASPVSPNKKRGFREPFTRPEIVFFLVYFLLFNILTDFEYNFYEKHNYILFVKDIPMRLVFGLDYMIPFAFCHKVLIRGVLFKKRYLLFFCMLIAFLVLLNFYLPGSYWLIARMAFLPADITKLALKYYMADTLIHFSVVYIFRELLVISCLAYFIRSVRQEKDMLALRQEQLSAELKYLKVQLQPHFFFNTLNNIYALTLQGSAGAAPLVAKLSDMMRYILYDASGQKSSLQQEIGFLKNYAEVESVRYGENISILFETQGIAQYARIEPLLLLPFIENAFKHGIREESGNGYVKIIICGFCDELTMEVINSKAPAVGGRRRGVGIGLENAAKRLSLLYPQQHSLEIREDEAVYEVRLTIQLENND